MGRRRPAMNSPTPASPAAETANNFLRTRRRRGRLAEDSQSRRGRGSPGRRRRGGSPPGRGVTALMYACQQGDVDKVRRILKAQPFSLMQRDRTGKSPLHYCTTSDRITAAQAADLLVMAAPDLVEGRDDEGFTPLHLAVIAGNIQLATFLLANKADVTAVDSERHTVVHWATVCGETEALRAVLAAGAPVSTPDIHGGYPLHYAAQMCGGGKESMLGLQVLHTLLSHPDINVTVEDGDRRQPLLWAASAGSAKAVLALVRAGAAVQASDKDGLTALHCAASRGHTDCIDTLLTLCGACPDVIDTNGCTALHYAVTLGHADATALLLAHGANPNRQDRKGRSPAHCGCAKGQFETVKLLGAQGANLWLRNARGDFPLHEAAASGRRDLVKWLLDMRPSQVNARNNDGRCPLHMAALHDNADMCKILIDAGAQVNPVLRTSKNVFMTPLDCALQRGFRSTAKFLQLHGGLLASKLANMHTKTEYLSSSTNLNIRDDVTVWGGSSDDERENGELSGVERKKKSYKKKVKRENGVTQARRIKMKGTTSDEVLRYSSEVIVSDDRNGTINIEQNGEIVLSDRQREKQTFVKSKIPVAATEAKEKRPKSAKRTKAASKTTSGSEELQNVETATQESVDTKISVETVIEKTAPLKTQEILEEIVPKIDGLMPEKIEAQPKEEADKQSLLSSASIDEGEKQVVVEAHVHSPPKGASLEQTTVATGKESVEGTAETDKDLVAAEISQETDGAIKQTEGLASKEEANQVSKEDQKADEASKQNKEGASKEEGDQGLKEDPETDGPPKQMNEGVPIEEAHQLSKVDQETHGAPKQNEKGASKEETNQASMEDQAATREAPSEEPKETESGAPLENIQIEVASKEGMPEEVPEAHLDANQTEEAITTEATTAAGDTLEVEQQEASKKIEELEHLESGSRSSSREGERVKRLTKQATISVAPSEILTEVTGADLVKSAVEDAVAAVTDEVAAAQQEIATATEETVQEAAAKVEETKEVIVEAADATIEGAKALISSEVPEAQKSKTSSSEKEVLKENETTKQPHEAVAAKSKKSKAKPVTETKPKKKQFLKPKPQKPEAQYDASVEMKTSEEESTSPSSSSKDTKKEHKSFRVLDDSEEPPARRARSKSQVRKAKPRAPLAKERSKSEETSRDFKRSKIPTPIRDLKRRLSKSDRQLDRRVPALSDLRQDSKHLRSESSMTAPIHASTYSDNERDTGSDMEELLSSATRRKRLKKRAKSRGAKSAGSDYESSNLIDSGFEPSPRSSRLPKWKNVSERGVDMTSVTQTIQSNIRRYHLERKIFQHLLELKRLQIRAGQHNEAILVKRAIDAYHKSCASTVGAGRYIPEDFTFKSFERFLYHSLRKLQKNGSEYLQGLPESPEQHPLLCTQGTHKCMHATHAYTGVPCAAYLPKMDHHTIPKIGFEECKPSGFLPQINQKSKGVTLELCHGNEKQMISLPADRLDQNKRYYVTFTVKGNENSSSPEDESGHRHSKSD